MTKAELQEKLTSAGVVWSSKMSVLELEALWKKVSGKTSGNASGMKWRDDPMKGLSSQLKSVLQDLALQMNIPFSAKETRGELLLKIREATEEAPTQKMIFGKYKNHQLKEALVDVSYAEWAMTQEFAHPQGNLLKAMASLHYGMFVKMVKSEEKVTPKEEEFERIKKEVSELKKENSKLKKEKESPDASKVPVPPESGESSEELQPEPTRHRKMEPGSDSSLTSSWMELGEKRKGAPTAAKSRPSKPS